MELRTPPPLIDVRSSFFIVGRKEAAFLWYNNGEMRIRRPFDDESETKKHDGSLFILCQL